MDRLTALCLLRELLTYPTDDLFDLVGSGTLEDVLGSAEETVTGARGRPVAWGQKPASLEEWQALYLSTFEVGIPAPKSPLQETFYAEASSASELIRENYLFYRHFAYPLAGDPAPHDSLPKQLGFLAHLEGLAADPEASPDGRESAARARDDYLARHLRPWLPKLVDRARAKGVEAFYVRALEILEELLEAEGGRHGQPREASGEGGPP